MVSTAEALLSPTSLPEVGVVGAALGVLCADATAADFPGETFSAAAVGRPEGWLSGWLEALAAVSDAGAGREAGVDAGTDVLLSASWGSFLGLKLLTRRSCNRCHEQSG